MLGKDIWITILSYDMDIRTRLVSKSFKQYYDLMLERIRVLDLDIRYIKSIIHYENNNAIFDISKDLLKYCSKLPNLKSFRGLLGLYSFFEYNTFYWAKDENIDMLSSLIRRLDNISIICFIYGRIINIDILMIVKLFSNSCSNNNVQLSIVVNDESKHHTVCKLEYKDGKIYLSSDDDIFLFKLSEANDIMFDINEIKSDETLISNNLCLDKIRDLESIHVYLKYLSLSIKSYITLLLSKVNKNIIV